MFASMALMLLSPDGSDGGNIMTLTPSNDSTPALPVEVVKAKRGRKRKFFTVKQYFYVDENQVEHIRGRGKPKKGISYQVREVPIVVKPKKVKVVTEEQVENEMAHPVV